MPKIDLIELHMAAAHFPIALLMSSAFCDVVGRSFKRPELQTTAYWMHLLGIVGGAVTISFGLFGNPFLKDVGLFGNPFHNYGGMATRAVRHQWVGLTAFALFAMLAVWRVKHRNAFDRFEGWVYAVFTAAAFALIGLTGYLGAHVMD